MCKFKSGVVRFANNTLDVFTDPEIDSHTELCAKFGLAETSTLVESTLAKVEYAPTKSHGDLDSYKLKLDEDRVPQWWDEHKERAEKIMHSRLLSENVLRDGEFDEIKAGTWLVLEGQPIITQSGGEVWTCGSSQPIITQSGGLVRTCDSSQPIITQSGGLVWTCGSSQPIITQSGGVVRTCDSSQPIITQSGGLVWTCGSSQPSITQSGGVVRTCGSSHPSIRQAGCAK